MSVTSIAGPLNSFQSFPRFVSKRRRRWKSDKQGFVKAFSQVVQHLKYGILVRVPVGFVSAADVGTFRVNGVAEEGCRGWCSLNGIHRLRDGRDYEIVRERSDPC